MNLHDNNTDEDDECIHGLGMISACVLCNGRAKREQDERWKVQYMFDAKYQGLCTRCKDVILVDGRVAMTHGGVICQGCVAPDDPNKDFVVWELT